MRVDVFDNFEVRNNYVVCLLLRHACFCFADCCLIHCMTVRSVCAGRCDVPRHCKAIHGSHCRQSVL